MSNKKQLNAFKTLSEYRQEQLSGQIERGSYKGKNSEDTTNASFVVSSSSGIKKTAQVMSNTTGSQWRGSGDTVKQISDVYSPLWLNSNLNMPRDRSTINAWCRSFFILNPIVQNAINLHSTYPISKLNIKCPNKKVEKFFNDMIEEIDLMNVCVQVAQEYWLLGEAFVYAELDHSKLKWSRLVIQNPDYITVKKTVMADEPMIMMRPDDNLRRIVFSNKASDIEQRKQINETIIEHIRRGENIPLDSFYVSHLARKPNPYDVRGLGLPVGIFRQLMLYDKIRECYDDKTEVLTDQGFKKFNEVIEYSENIKEQGVYLSAPKKGIKLACHNPESNSIEYHEPISSVLKDYNGEMHYYSGNKVNICITPNHNLWVKERFQKSYKNYWEEFDLKTSSQVLSKKKWYKFNSFSNYTTGDTVDKVNVLGKEIPIDLYLTVLGYVISEGCVYSNYNNKRYDNFISVNQATSSDCYNHIKNSFNEFAKLLGKKCRNFIKPYNKEKNYEELWESKIHGKDIFNYFKNEICEGDETNSYSKKIPRWVLNLNKNLLKIILFSLVKGDGHEENSKHNSVSKNFSYTTVSKQLANDMYELVYKCGYIPNIYTYFRKNRNEYVVKWSNTNYGVEPVFRVGKINNNDSRSMNISTVNYSGKVWCFEVPTGLFITRRNGKITIQGNCKFVQSDNMINPLTLIKIGSADYKPTAQDLETWRNTLESAQYDKDFKIFTHEAVTIERIGAGQGIYDTSGDITQLLKEMYVGLMVPQVLMDGGGDITYANGGISLDVLRQRYMQFRNMMASWLKRKIFAPISKLNEFYEYTNGEKSLIVPDVDWNHMSLFDAGDYISVLVQLAGDPKKVSLQTLYRSLGLEYEEERRKLRKEDISEAIRKKEQASLERMPLNELRSIGDEDEIPEIVDTPIPGESPYEGPTGASSGGSEPGGGIGLPGMETPGGPPPPSLGKP